MPGIVKLPQVVQEAMRVFADLVACEPQRCHFGESLIGLMIAERKSVSGINREFAVTTDQSCLNRFLTAADWDVAELNERWPKWLQQSPDTRYSNQCRRTGSRLPSCRTTVATSPVDPEDAD